MMSVTVTVSEDVAEKLQQLARSRQQNVDVLLESLLEQAWLQEKGKIQEAAEPIKNTRSTAESTFSPRPGSITEQIWGALGEGTEDEFDEIFSYDYNSEDSDFDAVTAVNRFTFR